MDEKIVKEIEELLTDVENDVKNGNTDDAIEKIGKVKDKIKQPLPGTGTNGGIK